mmetsp:Transcript_4074/g.4711  ORF Transcript_4074/g.4711 Transcript_4074/m.4711 type:complete len:126 (-) Transcript_4074:1392-1769(-)
MISYAVSKKGAKAFSEGLCAELKLKGYHGIKVSLICPSHIDTPLFKGFDLPFNWTMSPRFVAGQIIQAIECERELVCLPRYGTLFLPVLALNEFWGSLHLPNVGPSPMTKWSPKQADKIFSQMKE